MTATVPALPYCADLRERRAAVAAHPTLNGIDYVEVRPNDHTHLSVVFLKPLPPGAYGIEADAATLISVLGGTRITGIRVLDAARQADGSLDVHVSAGGDYSPYTLEFDDAVVELDMAFRAVEFSFMAACPVDLDCAPPDDCPPELLPEPEIDYLAKDYEGFRRLLLDRIAVLAPDWTEQNPADLGITVLELLAYWGDRLSYYQDAVAQEQTLATARHRVSARRHARLVDYRMHDGRNAWTWAHVTAAPGVGSLPLGTGLLTRVLQPIGGDPLPPGPTVDPAEVTLEALSGDPALAGAVVFETAHALALDARNNTISIHAFGDEQCCLPAGTTELHLFSRVGASTDLPQLAVGDFLLLEEVRGPRSGAAADADPRHRQVVRIADVAATSDPLYRKLLAGDGSLQLRTSNAQPPLPLLRVRLDRAEALNFSLCLSARTPELGAIEEVSVARGNVVLCDHGLTVTEALSREALSTLGRFPRLALGHGPLTFQAQPGAVEHDPLTGRPTTERRTLAADPADCSAAVAVIATLEGGDGLLFTAQPDLLGATEFDALVVAEVEGDQTWLRFGDDVEGRGVDDAVSFTASYRVGTGRSGNVGREALAHVLLPGAAPAAGLILGVRNPLPGACGVDPETVEEVRRRAPEAFRATTLRAVTPADYAGFARLVPDVKDAVAAFRWTGSWYTVFVGVDPLDHADLVVEPGGRVLLAPRLRDEVATALDRVRLAGYDLELRGPHFVPLRLGIHVCAAAGYFRQDVGRAVAQALSARVAPDGTRGLFAPGSFRFGEPLYLSRIYDAVARVEGVDSCDVTTFQRYDRPPNGELQAGVLQVGPWEIVQCDSDPSFQERGVLELTLGGGTA